MTLLIDTTDFHDLHFALINKGEITEYKKEIAFNQNYKTNEFLQKFLAQQKVKPKDIAKIVVCSGPGSFTGIRVGVSMAQALSFALSIPLIALPKSKIPADLLKLDNAKIAKSIHINYGQKPNITKAKK